MEVVAVEPEAEQGGGEDQPQRGGRDGRLAPAGGGRGLQRLDPGAGWAICFWACSMSFIDWLMVAFMSWV